MLFLHRSQVSVVEGLAALSPLPSPPPLFRCIFCPQEIRDDGWKNMQRHSLTFVGSTTVSFVRRRYEMMVGKTCRGTVSRSSGPPLRPRNKTDQYPAVP
ncbi:hypothetical protein QE152_g7612 [Popillia japonica]|uniref:Uncharacterized protein n=1 Tax=Popillia japonica TaxID=7064 RepID=A0AAW1M9N1_POPJA